MLGGAEGGAGVEANHFGMLRQTELPPDAIRGLLIGRRREQFQPMSRRRAAGGFGETIVVVDDRRRLEAAIRRANRFEPIGQKQAAAVAIEPDDPAATSEPSHERGAEGIGKQYGELGP